MKKKQTAKRASFLIGAILYTLAGCVKQTNTPIVSEKMEGAQESRVGEEGTQGEKQGMAANAEKVRQQADVPETYTLEICSEDITIMGNVSVETPEKERIPVVEVQYLPYTQEELDEIKELLKEEVGITEWTLKSQDNPKTYMSPDQTYTLSLARGNKQERPMVWLSCPGISDGSNKEDEVMDLSGFSMSENDRKAFQQEMEGKAKHLMEEMGMKDFHLEEVRWRQLSVSKDHSWSLSGQYGLRLYYRRKVEDMILVDNEWEYPAQYVEFLYKEDGTLLSVKNIGREELRVTPEYVEFLLPFSSVSQVFEQCMKTRQIDAETNARSDISVLTEGYPGAVPHGYLTITEVKLAYGLEYGEGGKGKLVPVWAFYGREERGFQDQSGVELKIPRTSLNGSKSELLLVVNAENGSVYGELKEIKERR